MAVRRQLALNPRAAQPCTRGMKHSAIVLAAAIAAFPACATAQMHIQAQASLATATTVPFTVSGRHIFVKATVDGKPFAFVFDTAGAASLTPAARETLKLPAIARAQITGVGNAPVPLDIVKPKRASIGDATVDDAYFLVLPSSLGFASPYPEVPFGGILGREFFQTLVLTIDYTKSTLTLTNPSVFHSDPSAQALAMTMREGMFPNVQATIDGATGSFDLDAGSSEGVMLTQTFAKDNAIVSKMPKTLVVEAGHGVGGAIGGTAGRIDAFELGNASFANVVAVVTDANGGAFASPGLAGNIGYEILRRFSVTIDAPGRTAYFLRNYAYGEPFAFTRSGLFLNRDSGKAVVSRVVENSPASAAGIKPGDVLVSINGRPAASLTADQIHDVSLQPAGTVVRARVERDGKSVAVEMTLRDLL